MVWQLHQVEREVATAKRKWRILITAHLGKRASWGINTVRKFSVYKNQLHYFIMVLRLNTNKAGPFAGSFF